MEIRYFAHSWLSDWNHGNAHFLRGLASALVRRGHRVRCYEDVGEGGGGWSLSQLRAEAGGAAAIGQMRGAYPELEVRLYGERLSGGVEARAEMRELPQVRRWEEELREAEVVIAHEWNPPELVEMLVRERRRWGYRVLLHDTHHRAWSEPAALERMPLRAVDGVVAFGESVRRVYERRWGVKRSYVLQEAADVERFQPGGGNGGPAGIVWIGNWGDEERTRELEEFLLEPARRCGGRAVVHGVRYPAEARARLAAAGIRFGGYLANLDAPRAYGAAGVAVHIPRRPYAEALAGIPTIRVFEALACGAALVCAPWEDSEGLFTAGEDYWRAENGAEMRAHWVNLLADEAQRKKLGEHGAATVRARHTCGHRAEELEAICRDLD